MIVVIGGTRSDGGSERETGENYGKVEFLFEPVERGTNIFDLAYAVGVLAFAQAGAAEVEAEHGESEAVERLHGVEDDFIVQRAAEERMGMADDGGVRRAGRAGIEKGFQAAGGAGEEEGADAGGFVRHGLSFVVGRSLFAIRRSLLVVRRSSLNVRR